MQSSGQQLPSTVIFSSPAKWVSTSTNNGYWQYTTLFTPSQNIAGKQCMLKPKSILMQSSSTTTTHMDTQCIYFVSLSLPQPFNCASINSASDGASGLSITKPKIETQSNIIAAIHVGGHDAANYGLSPIQTDHPISFVRVPHSPQEVIVRLWKANANDVFQLDLASLTVVCEVIPTE